jgi:phage terminase large subunit-like protein
MSGAETMAMAARLAARGAPLYKRWIAAIPDAQIQGIHASWRLWARPGQMPPPGAWDNWLMLAGRGFGKTRAGAEWVNSLALAGDGDTRIALIAATGDEARHVMIEGESGLMNVGLRQERPQWQPSLGRVTWPNGAQAIIYSGSNPDGLRGPQHHYAWCDEIAKWAHPHATWMNMKLGLRLGVQPRVLATTTPRPSALLRMLIADPQTTVTRGATADNALLPHAFVTAVTQLYGGTRLGRQELDGEMIADAQGALWTRDLIDRCRTPPGAIAEDPVRVVIGVDPPAGTLSGTGGDACGIVVVALGRDGVATVIADASVAGQSPEGWARAVAVAAARHKADRVIAEANNGGAMVSSVLRAADAALPVKLVHAAHGKVTRAEPVSLLYEQGRVRHADAFPELEDELCGLTTGGGYHGPGRSPDRADALVWAVTALMLGRRAIVPRVRVV